jgi:hypothetical protein
MLQIPLRSAYLPLPAVPLCCTYTLCDFTAPTTVLHGPLWLMLFTGELILERASVETRRARCAHRGELYLPTVTTQGDDVRHCVESVSGIVKYNSKEQGMSLEANSCSAGHEAPRSLWSQSLYHNPSQMNPGDLLKYFKIDIILQSIYRSSSWLFIFMYPV